MLLPEQEDRDRQAGDLEQRFLGGRVNINDMVLVGVDDHVVEPPDLFKDRLPKKYADLAPQFLTKEDGTNVWSYEGTEVGNVALNAVAGRPKDEYGIEPTSFSDIRPGCYDVNERVKDMNANGVLGALCFPSFRSSAGSSSPGPRTRTSRSP